MKYKVWIFCMFFLLPILSDGQVDGETLFKKNCAACHSIDMRLVGPALEGVTERRDSAWIYQFVKGSQAMVNAGDSVAVQLFQDYNKIPMPDQAVTDEELASILSYIDNYGKITDLGENPIQRPPEIKVSNTPLNFSQFGFWIPYTIAIFLLIGVLFYLVENTSFYYEKFNRKD